VTTPHAHLPKHRDPHAGAVVRARRASFVAVRNALVLSSLASAATGIVVTGGVLLGDPAVARSPRLTSAVAAPAASPAAVAESVVAAASRTDLRSTTDPLKEAALTSLSTPGEARTEDLSDADPRVIARALLPEYGFSDDQFSCLDSLYVSESGWQIDADNPTSSAYGIPQALTRLHDLPADYMTSAESQIRWGLEYIQDSYGTPCSAWAFKRANNWY
jgi:hypothetical protein